MGGDKEPRWRGLHIWVIFWNSRYIYSFRNFNPLLFGFSRFWVIFSEIPFFLVFFVIVDGIDEC